MNNLFNSIGVRNIQELYEIKRINSNGVIELKDKNIVIFRINPANIIDCSNETKIKIYQAYLTCIRTLPNNFQMLISKEKTSFNSQIKECKERIEKVKNEGLKEALSKYIEYLKEISSMNNIYTTKHYLVVENLNSNEIQEIINVFCNLREFGVRIEKMTQKGGFVMALKNAIQIIAKNYLKNNIVANYVYKFFDKVISFVQTSDFMKKLNRIIQKVDAKKDDFIKKCEEWYNAFKNNDKDKINTISETLSNNTYVLNRYKDCAKENSIIQNMTKMINNNKGGFTENQKRLCEVLSQ